MCGVTGEDDAVANNVARHQRLLAAGSQLLWILHAPRLANPVLGLQKAHSSSLVRTWFHDLHAAASCGLNKLYSSTLITSSY